MQMSPFSSRVTRNHTEDVANLRKQNCLAQSRIVCGVGTRFTGSAKSAHANKLAGDANVTPLVVTQLLILVPKLLGGAGEHDLHRRHTKAQVNNSSASGMYPRGPKFTLKNKNDLLAALPRHSNYACAVERVCQIHVHGPQHVHVKRCTQVSI